jgi:hypothetical protein
MFDNMGDSLRIAFRDGLSDLFAFIPRLFGAVLLLVVGWLIGKVIGGLVTKALRAVRFNEVADKAEIDEFLRNAGIRQDPAAVVGGMARWFIYLTFFLAAFNALGLPQVSAVIDDVLTFIPKVVVAIVVLLAGALAGKLLGDLMRGSLRSMGLQNPNLYATAARFAVIAFAAIAALSMLGIAPTIINMLWTGMVALVVGTLVLAFGLGGRQAASDVLLGRLLRSELEPGVEVQTGAYAGRVRTIGTLFTTLETNQGVVKVPNSELTAQHLRMTPEAFQQQVQKREELKAKAKQAMEESSRKAAGSGTNGGTRTTLVAPAGGRRDAR